MTDTDATRATEFAPGSPIDADADDALKENLRAAAMVIAGFEGDDEEARDPRSFRQVLRDEGLSWYPLLALGSLSMAQAIGSAGTQVLDPIVAETLGLSATIFIVLDLLAQIVGFLIPLLTSLLVKERPVRAIATVVAGVVWAVAVIWAGFVPSAIWWIVYKLVDSGTSSVSATVEGSLSMDLYPPEVRVRAFAVLFGGQHLASLIVPGFVIILISGFEMTWRGVFLVNGIVALVFTLVALGLRDPGYGVHEKAHLRDLIRDTLGDAGEEIETDPPDPPHPGFLEVYRTLWAIKPMRFSLMGVAVSGLSAPIFIALSFYLINEVDFGPVDLAIMAMIGSAAGLIGLAVLAPIGDAWFRKSPKLVYWIAAGLTAVGTMATVLNVFNATKTGAYVLAGLSSLALSFIGPASTVGGMTVVPAELRNYTGSVFAMAQITGTTIGVALFAGTSNTIGFSSAIIALAVTTLAAAILTGIAGNHLLDSVDESNERYIDEEMTRLRIANGWRPPIIECEGIDASYGSVQALYQVDLSIEEGEMVALLGLNGSGKSTLLKVMAGLMYPDEGTVRFEGNLVSFASAESRVDKGIVMMRGGHAVFPSMTVGENLMLASNHPTAAGRCEHAEEIVERFPALGELWHRQAALLSGGERQMLGLGRAFLLQPKLLLIDELSLGLAPLVVERLMADVRDINSQGTTVVLVEQSINVAVELVDRAVFLDRGVVRFDGPIDELKGRDDLLRAVFLRETLA